MVPVLIMYQHSLYTILRVYPAGIKEAKKYRPGYYLLDEMPVHFNLRNDILSEPQFFITTYLPINNIKAGS